ncbi:hypothetical protein [Haladaptatus paucihalophilus]|uniref:Uncharacterized protein n=2 Tax=Haladaptatus paucihalophilus DX253 TaxID=797209 RepID=A0A1M6QMP1_HALPU|nr:hypothetical protein [Haladaptatus paucihalophilus]SHK21522.1 hypothetical protein SAMN05444342_0973 [Haladaptatus paucihalophilus DX253]
MTDTVDGNNTLLPGMAATGISVFLVVVSMWFWTEFAFAKPPLSIPVMVYFLGGIFLVQLARSVLMDDWTRRVAALGVVVGALVMLFGMRPTGYCADATASNCGTSFDPVFPILALGFLLTTALLYVDIRRR